VSVLAPPVARRRAGIDARLFAIVPSRTSLKSRFYKAIAKPGQTRYNGSRLDWQYAVSKHVRCLNTGSHTSRHRTMHAVDLDSQVAVCFLFRGTTVKHLSTRDTAKSISVHSRFERNATGAHMTGQEDRCRVARTP
jgi:hypothetical protein